MWGDQPDIPGGGLGPAGSQGPCGRKSLQTGLWPLRGRAQAKMAAPHWLRDRGDGSASAGEDACWAPDSHRGSLVTTSPSRWSQIPQPLGLPSPSLS